VQTGCAGWAGCPGWLAGLAGQAGHAGQAAAPAEWLALTGPLKLAAEKSPWFSPAGSKLWSWAAAEAPSSAASSCVDLLLGWAQPLALMLHPPRPSWVFQASNTGHFALHFWQGSRKRELSTGLSCQCEYNGRWTHSVGPLKYGAPAFTFQYS